MSKLRLGIISDHHDLHALAARKLLIERYGVDCRYVEVDRIHERGGLSWSMGATSQAILPDFEGKYVDVATLDLIWYRRGSVPQVVSPAIKDDVVLEFINQSTPIAVLGLLRNAFHGIWVSDPISTHTAENKLVQLRAAAASGLTVPRTLVSNDPAIVRQFCAEVGQTIVKPLRPSRHVTVPTQHVTAEHLAIDDSIRSCPAIYQELVPGRSHIRAHVFGDYVSAIRIDSDELDWRLNLNVPCSIFEPDAGLEQTLRSVVSRLGLKMGIIDLKLRDDEPIWLEINPQGQYLFAEGLTGLSLNAAMAEFLYGEARAAVH